jgi:hypothetical protein
MPLAEKRGFAHLEVDTSGPVEETDRAAELLAGDLARLARWEGDARRTSIDELLGGLVHGPETGPRGMTPASLLAAAAGARGLEMEDLARRLTPPAQGPWYRTAAEAAPGGPAAPLAIAVAAWALCRGPADPPFLAAAAGSVARLSHTDPGARADACLLALVAQDVAAGGGNTREVEVWAERHVPLASRFGGAKPSGRLAPVWKAARLHPSDPEGAAGECARDGGEPTLASALAGLGVPVEPSPLTQTLRAALEAAAWGSR